MCLETVILPCVRIDLMKQRQEHTCGWYIRHLHYHRKVYWCFCYRYSSIKETSEHTHARTHAEEREREREREREQSIEQSIRSSVLRNSIFDKPGGNLCRETTLYLCHPYNYILLHITIIFYSAWIMSIP